MITVGLTGSLGAGKSTVAALFKKLGAEVLDADLLVHALLRRDPGVIRRVRKAFGPGIFSAGRIDRAKLAAEVFGQPRQLKKLTDIVHPAVVRDIRRRIGTIGRRRRKAVVIVDAALLVESGLHRHLDYCAVIKLSARAQRARIKQKGVLSWEEARRRISSQLSTKEKLNHADIVIDNNGSLATTKKQVGTIWRRLRAKI